jgi:cobalt/nickel transport system permease protein
MWRVRLADAHATDVFVDPASGEVAAVRNRTWRWYDGLWSLHVLGWVKRDNPAHVPLRIFGGLALVVALSGVALLVAHWTRRLRRRRALPVAIAVALTLASRPAHAMHLAEGILPLDWAALWVLASLPFIAIAILQLRRREQPEFWKPFVAMVAAAVFLISCMPVPVPTAGTCSHPCGTGLAAILIGPWLTVLVTLVALILQALLLAHGGITTLGADVISMGVAGAFAGWAVFTLLRRGGVSLWWAAFAAGVLSDWATYATTSFELATALPGARFVEIALAFVPTQLPLGILEGLLSAGAVTFLARRRRDILVRLALVPA